MFTRVIQSYKNLPIGIGKISLTLLIVSVFFILKEYTDYVVNKYNYPFSWFYITIRIILNYIIWLLFMPVVNNLVKVWQSRNNKIRNVFILLVGVLLLSVLHNAISVKMYDIVFYLNSGYMKEFFGKNGLIGLVVGSFSSLIELLVIMAIFLVIHYQKQYLLNQKELIATQLDSLQMQLHPHFLFNTLHSISSMIDIDPIMAQKMLTKIGDLLRTMLENDLEQMIPIKKELDFIKSYLDLEQIRYSDKMVVNYYISSHLLKVKVPNMILQPIVENVIKFGVSSSINQCIVDIKIEEKKHLNQNSMLAIEVTNTTEKNQASIAPRGTGVGLKNIRKRLNGYYGERYFFESSFVKDNFYVTQILIPMKK